MPNESLQGVSSDLEQAPPKVAYRITPLQAIFLTEYAKSHSKVKALDSAGLSSLREVEQWRQEDDSTDGLGFRAALAEAEALLADRLESAAFERGVEGWDEPVYQGGELVGTKRRFSDNLLQLMLEAKLPEKYGKRGTQTTATLEVGLVGGDRGPLPSPQALEEVYEVSQEFGQMLARRVGKRVRESA